MTKSAYEKALHRFSQSAKSSADRSALLGVVARTEFHLLLLADSDGTSAEPFLLDVNNGKAAVVFDKLDLMAGFQDGVSNFISASGRDLAVMLHKENLLLTINPGCEDTSFILEQNTLEWMSAQTNLAPKTIEFSVKDIGPARDADIALVTALDEILPNMQGLAERLVVAGLTEDAEKGMVIFFLNTQPGAEDTLTQLIHEMVTFSAGNIPDLNVGFVRNEDPLVNRLKEIGLHMQLPKLPVPTPRPAPGSDPDKPPKLN